MLIAGISDSMRMHPDSAWELSAGMTLLFSAMLWFIAARVITLLAQIAFNTHEQRDALLFQARENAKGLQWLIDNSASTPKN